MNKLTSAKLRPLLCSAISCALVGLPQAADEAAAQPEVACAVPQAATAQEVEGWARWADQLGPVHKLATGRGARVAIIDTGVSPHYRLRPVIAGGDVYRPGPPASTTWVWGEPVPPPGVAGPGLEDCDGHGTIVAGIIAAQSGPDGVVGVAPDAELISIRQGSSYIPAPVDASGATATGGNLGGIVAALNLALDAGATVATLSVSACVPPEQAQQLDQSALEEVLRRAETAGMVVVVAAGNLSHDCTADSVVIPANYPTVISVGASDDSHQPAVYSKTGSQVLYAQGSYTAGLSHQPGVDLAAAIRPPHSDTANILAGTSFAAPVVAGIVALLQERYPGSTPAEIRARLHAGVDPRTRIISPSSAIGAVLPATNLSPALNATPAATENTSPARRNAGWVLLTAAGLLVLGWVFAGVRSCFNFPWRLRRPIAPGQPATVPAPPTSPEPPA